MSACDLGNGLRVIDLTKQLDPETESRRCHLFRFNTGGAHPGFPHHYGPDQPSGDSCGVSLPPQ